jgi:hypothetical protein
LTSFSPCISSAMPPVLPVYVADWIVEVGKSCGPRSAHHIGSCTTAYTMSTVCVARESQSNRVPRSVLHQGPSHREAFERLATPSSSDPCLQQTIGPGRSRSGKNAPEVWAWDTPWTAWTGKLLAGSTSLHSGHPCLEPTSLSLARRDPLRKYSAIVTALVRGDVPRGSNR